MKKVLTSTLAALSILAVAGCSTTERRAGTGAAVGAGTGALVAAATGSSGSGVATGALIGGAAGALIGAATSPGDCRYRDANGNIYVAACPSNY
ncbi:hypothetical protein [Hoeflea sp.]|uniref:hypothetical protein n=1 Tax=Hoeflea sp. TaxID=1940281 RepID=UPI003B525697